MDTERNISGRYMAGTPGKDQRQNTLCEGKGRNSKAHERHHKGAFVAQGPVKVTRCGIRCINELFATIKRLIKNKDILSNKSDEEFQRVLKGFDEAANGVITKAKKRG